MSSRRLALPGSFLAVALLLAGCETTAVTTDGRRMPPQPTAAPKVPVSARANAMAVRVGAKAADTDGNGFPDEVVVEAYLFSEPHPSPMYADGAFVFQLFPAGQAVANGRPPLVQWRIDGEELRLARFRSPVFGPGHVFRLSLLETGGDQYPSLSTNLTCRFEPIDGGEAVKSTGVYQINIGRGDGRGS